MAASKHETLDQTDRRQFLRRLSAVGATMPFTPLFSVLDTWAAPSEAALKRHSSVDLGETQIKISLKDYHHKMRYYYRSHTDDVWVTQKEFKLLQQVTRRLDGVYKLVGHSNFSLVSFDKTLRMAKTYSQVGGPFTKTELEFLETLFYRPAIEYGFYGIKPVGAITHRINKREIVNVNGTGNHLFRGEAEKLYQRMRADVGRQLVLTSGVRNVIKQFHLFLHKAIKTKGNLSRASRSLAPPGYSFHGVSDFDVGQADYGHNNFNAKFAASNVYQKVLRLDYFKIRYTQYNMLGVRYEPWHVLVEKV